MPKTEDDNGSPPGQSNEYIAQQGDCISSIAKDKGFFWQTIWDDLANADLKQRRQNPNVLMPGDHVVIPALRQKQEDGATENKHRFVRKGEPSALRLRLLDAGQARANEDFMLKVDGAFFSGTTDGDGRLSVSIPGNAREAELRIGEDVYRLQLGEIDPVSEISGVQTRLINLGFQCSPTGELDDQTLEALNCFREAAGLETSDDIDDDTRDKLEHWHDAMQAQSHDEVDQSVPKVKSGDPGLEPDPNPPSEDELSTFDDALGE